MSERKGLATGIIMGAFGFGAFIFSFLALTVINPDNSKPEKQPDGSLMYSALIAERVSPCLLLVVTFPFQIVKLMFILAACFGSLGLIAILLLKRNPSFV